MGNYVVLMKEGSNLPILISKNNYEYKDYLELGYIVHHEGTMKECQDVIDEITSEIF